MKRTLQFTFEELVDENLPGEFTFVEKSEEPLGGEDYFQEYVVQDPTDQRTYAFAYRWNASYGFEENDVAKGSLDGEVVTLVEVQRVERKAYDWQPLDTE